MGSWRWGAERCESYPCWKGATGEGGSVMRGPEDPAGAIRAVGGAARCLEVGTRGVSWGLEGSRDGRWGGGEWMAGRACRP